MGPENIGVDWLHTISLGVSGFWIAEVIWDIINKNIFRFGGAAADRVELTVGQIGEEFGTWAKAEAKAGRKHTLPQKFVALMFGKSTYCILPS